MSDPLGAPFLTDVLTGLVRAQSVNPGTFEEAMAREVMRRLEGLPVEAKIVRFAEGRPSVGAILRGRGDGPALVLNGHTDTVPIDDIALWSKPPFGAEVDGGYLYGRGACDMKAGLAAQIAVAHHLASRLDELHGSLVLHFAAGEERGEPGTLSLLENGFGGDLGIVTEPTSLAVSVATRGAAFFRIRIRGRSIHASRAHFGINPILRLGPVLEVVEAYAREIEARPHPLLPGGSCTPTLVSGGVKENAVPDTCELTLDRRLLPSESGDEELEELRRRLGALRERDADFDFEIEHLIEPIAGAEVPAGSPLAARVSEAVGAVTGTAAPIVGTPYGSDVRNLVNDAGIEAVTFGPGDVTECHCPDERVSVDELRTAAVVLARVAESVLAPA